MQNLDAKRGLTPGSEQLGLTGTSRKPYHTDDPTADNGGQTWADVHPWCHPFTPEQAEAAARRLDRSEAQHILRVRHQHSARAQRHVRVAVGW